jgi:hypothetical protein
MSYKKEIIFQDHNRFFWLQHLIFFLVNNAGGNIRDDAKMYFLTYPVAMTGIKKATQSYLANVQYDYLKALFPNIVLIPVPQYAPAYNAGVGQAQLIVDEINGQKTLDEGFTYQLMMHRLVTLSTTAYQKQSAGVSGALLYLPMAVSTMTGV